MKRTLLHILCLLAAIPMYCLAEGDPGWPRVYESGESRLVLYQPQVEEWTGYGDIDFRSAFTLTASKGANKAYGIVAGHAGTKVDRDARLVQLSNLTLEYRFPNTPEDEAKRLENIARSLLQLNESMEVSLDRVIAYMEPAKTVQRSVDVDLNPPKLFYSNSPAVLIIFVGRPIFKPVPSTELMFAVNTNWDLFLNQGDSRYYLLLGDGWISTEDPLAGKWTPVASLPASFRKIPKGGDWDDVLQNIPGKTPGKAPKIFATTEPAELIVTDGEPAYTPILGTKLMFVSNTESDLFLHNEQKTYYYLVAGRWFSATQIAGPWKAATNSLPEDFADIPPSGPKGHVLASVPDTEEAIDAVLLASIPQVTTINRADAKFDAAYDGPPVLKPIEGTTVQYVVNTPSDVFFVNQRYYACSEGLWYTSAAASGPWILADSVPQAIYSIPVSSPKHNVTYVTVYQSSPTTVTTGYTSGYNGQYVASGLLMFGAGIALGAALSDDDDHHDHYYYPPPPAYYSYGCGASYNYHGGGYYRSASHYGPYGGAGRSAYYNPSTGAYSRSAKAYGPNGAAFARQGYNPNTGNYGARAGGVNASGAYSRGYVSNGDEWARGGQKANASGRAGWAETSEGGKAVAYDKRGAGGRGFVAKEDDGDLYAGKNGNVYKRDDNGEWYSRQDGDWKKPDNAPSAENRAQVNSQARSQAKSQAQSRTQSQTQAQAQARAQNKGQYQGQNQGQYQGQRSKQGTTASSTSASSRANSYRTSQSNSNASSANRQLNYDSAARQRGNSLSSRQGSSGYSRSNTTPSSFSRGGGGGGGGRSGGGGGRGGRR